jgi:hypothetical protein
MYYLFLVGKYKNVASLRSLGLSTLFSLETAHLHPFDSAYQPPVAELKQAKQLLSADRRLLHAL